MTTWLPAACIGIVVLCTLVGLTEPMFNSNSHNVRGGDRLLGAIIGLVIGVTFAVVFYVIVRLVELAL